MTTEERMELGAKYKHEMNCCQAVVKAFADTVDVDEATLHRLASGFGSGMGTMEGTCGALVGAIMIASLRAKDGEAMKLSRQILPRFKELHVKLPTSGVETLWIHVNTRSPKRSGGKNHLRRNDS